MEIIKYFSKCKSHCTFITMNALSVALCFPQVMKMMGLNNAVHWVAWFITGFVQLSISVTALTAILKYGKVLLHSDPFIIWLFLTIYAVATIMFW